MLIFLILSSNYTDIKRNPTLSKVGFLFYFIYFLVNTFFFIIIIPIANIPAAIIHTNTICVVLTTLLSKPVGGDNVINSVAFVSGSFAASAYSPIGSPSALSAYGFAFPATDLTSLLPTVFSVFIISTIFSISLLSSSDE